jgi:hypothetical protein
MRLSTPHELWKAPRPEDFAMAGLDVHCPHCKRKHYVQPQTKYKVCERCGTPHCIYAGAKCAVQSCAGWLKEREAPR